MCKPIIKNNTIINSKELAIDYAHMILSKVYIDASYNYWGTTIESEINGMIDGNLIITPFLITSPV